MSGPELAGLHDEVHETAKKYGVTESRAFAMWFAVAAFRLSYEEAYDATAYDAANDKGIDLFWVDSAADRVLVAQIKYSENNRAKASPKDIEMLEGATKWLASPADMEHEGREELASASHEYVEAINAGAPVQLYYVCVAPKDANVDKAVRVHAQDWEKTAAGKSISYVDIELVADHWAHYVGKDKRIEHDSVQISPDRTYEVRGGFGRAVVSSVNAGELVRLYEDYGDRLFARNVRLYLGDRKGSVNAGIRETLKTGAGRDNFWAYNNGITFVCSSLRYEKTRCRIVVREFCVVNGCQTTVSIYNHAQETAEGVDVLVRFIQAEPDIINDVIRYNNAQNAIPAWAMVSQNPTQERLKRELQALDVPFFYALRPGETAPKQAGSPYRRSDGSISQIKSDLLGQYKAAFGGDPVLAYKNKGEIFKPQTHDRVFPPDTRVQEVLLVWHLGEACKEERRSRLTNEAEKSEDLPILNKGAHLFALAVAGRLIPERMGAASVSSRTPDQLTSVRAKRDYERWARTCMNIYITAFRNVASMRKDDEPATLVRQPQFIEDVLDRARDEYQVFNSSPSWADGALPVLPK